MGHGGRVREPPFSDGPAPRVARPSVVQGGVYYAAATPDRPIMQAQHRATYNSKETKEWALVRSKMMFGFTTPGAAAKSAPTSEKILC